MFKSNFHSSLKISKALLSSSILALFFNSVFTVFCSKFMYNNKCPSLRFIFTPPLFKGLFMIFPVGHFIMTTPL